MLDIFFVLEMVFKISSMIMSSSSTSGSIERLIIPSGTYQVNRLNILIPWHNSGRARV